MNKSRKSRSFVVTPIGFVSKKDQTASIVVDHQYREGLKQVKHFSHIHVFWWADQSDAASLERLTARPPYADYQELGVFACRAEYRPNPIMVTVCRVKRIDEKNGVIALDGIDAFDQTPVIDIKPYIPVCDRVESVKVPASHKNWPSWYDAEFDPTAPDYDSSGGNENEQYPTTGRIGRLARQVLKQTDRATVTEVFRDWKQYRSQMTKRAGSEWIETVMYRLEEKAGEEKTRSIMKQCGRECFDSIVMLKKVAEELSDQQLTVQEFIASQNEKFGKYTHYSLADDGAIILEQFNCQCLVKHVKKPFSKNTYCQCGVGCREKYFSQALGKKVKVILLESRATGGASCRFKVIEG